MPSTIVRPNGDMFTFDVELSFSASPEDAITSHPIEDGAEVTDHVQARPLPISIVGVMSDRGQPGKAFRPTAVGRILATQEWFESIRGELVTVRHPVHGTFRNMVLARAPVSTTTRETAEFSLGFQRVEIARRETAVLPPLAMRASIDLGQQPTVPVTATAQEQQTLAVILADASGASDTFNALTGGGS